MYLGQSVNLDFAWFLAWCAPPALLSLMLLYAWARWVSFRDVQNETASIYGDFPYVPVKIHSAVAFDRYHTGKALVLTGLVIVLLFADLPRHLVILGMAALLLTSRRLTSQAF